MEPEPDSPSAGYRTVWEVQRYVI